MNSIQDLSHLVCENPNRDWKEYGEVSVSMSRGMILFNYTPKAQFEGRWNWFERVSRGLILDMHTGEVLARPFDKFFNWGERGHFTNAHIITITEKLDGSLGILYGRNQIATRGSFSSEQAKWATNYLRRYNLKDLSDELTLLFEIIYPDNRVVVDYGGREDLVLLAARNRLTGAYLPFFPDLLELADALGFNTPRVFGFNSVADIIEACHRIGPAQEGWVVEFSDGQRFKFKGDEYTELHRLLTGLSYNRVVEAMREGVLDDFLAAVPDEFHDDVDSWIAQVRQKVADVVLQASDAFARAPKGADRKRFALWVQENEPALSSYLFAMLDGKDIMPIVWKREF